MHFPDKSTIKKIIIILFAIAVILTSAYVSVKYFNNRFEKKSNNEFSSDFLTLIESGNLSASNVLWPQVYTTKKEDSEFIESFSNLLYINYSKYYDLKYINETENTDLREICRLYFDFITVENFNNVADIIYIDYLNEKISYTDFLNAENEFYTLSKLTSVYIPDLLDSAAHINESRITYTNAIDIALTKDYSSAIELMRLVSPNDTIYYPKAIEKIDEYIIKLKELVKNGS